jgi:hypothetical protein
MRDSEPVRRIVGPALAALLGVAGAVVSVVVAPPGSAPQARGPAFVDSGQDP